MEGHQVWALYMFIRTIRDTISGHLCKKKFPAILYESRRYASVKLPNINKIDTLAHNLGVPNRLMKVSKFLLQLLN